MAIAGAVCAVVWSACSSSGRDVYYEDAAPLEASSGHVVTLVDYLAGGRKAVDAFLQSLPEAEAAELNGSIAGATNACVRVAVRRELSGSSYEETSASGAIVATKSGRRVVLTAGHSFGTGDFTTTITTLAGSRLASAPDVRGDRPTAGDAGDWAILSIRDEEAARDLFVVGVDTPHAGELAFLLGYPDKSGVDATGRVVRGEAYANDHLSPLVTILRVESVSPLVLIPVAGALPLGGASGGGVFDRRGALIANLSGVQWEAKRELVTYRIDACPVTLVAGALE
jgi:hypothetical protein